MRKLSETQSKQIDTRIKNAKPIATKSGLILSSGVKSVTNYTLGALSL